MRDEQAAGTVAGRARSPLLRAACLGVLLALAACAGGPDVGPVADGDPRSARILLENVNRNGPMPVVTTGTVPGGLAAPEVAAALAQGVVGGADFVVQPEVQNDGPRVLLLFGPPEQLSPWRACAPDAVLGSGFGDGRRLAALVCDGPSTVAHLRAVAAGDTAADAAELLQAAGRRLFPDPYERYAYDRYSGVGYGGFGSFGSYGSSVGVGIGFGF
jgi:hypothetical protein